jgi:hypothetical protein
MKLLFSSEVPPEVGLLKSLLDESGIVSEIRNESTYSNFPGAAFQPEIWVLNDGEYAKACEVRDAWHQSSPVPNSVHLEGVESPRSALWVIGVVFFAGGLVLAWQSARARDWVRFAVSFFLFGMTAIIYNAARYSPPSKRSKTRRNS